MAALLQKRVIPHGVKSPPEPLMHFDALKATILGLISAHLDVFKAAVLGVIEGLTEFLPVSSTGHLLLMEHFFGWGDDAFGKSFAILIQLGAILALLSIYFGRLWALATSMFTEWAAARFVIGAHSDRKSTRLNSSHSSISYA